MDPLLCSHGDFIFNSFIGLLGWGQVVLFFFLTQKLCTLQVYFDLCKPEKIMFRHQCLDAYSQVQWNHEFTKTCAARNETGSPTEPVMNYLLLPPLPSTAWLLVTDQKYRYYCRILLRFQTYAPLSLVGGASLCSQQKTGEQHSPQVNARSCKNRAQA